MHNKRRFPNTIFGASLRLEGAALAIMFLLLFLLFVLLFMTLIARPVQAQSFNVIYSLAGGDECQNPVGVIFDRVGDLSGSTGGSFAKPNTI